jgi:hypothetical protein
MSNKQARELLIHDFEPRHVDASLKHFKDARDKYWLEEWDAVALKAGKFVEAVTKALMVYCEKAIPASRKFKASGELKALENAQINGSPAPDTIRIVIPKACIFIYEVVNNRGGRHDAGDIDANSMDAKTIIPLMSWVLAEMVRFCTKGGDADSSMALIDELTNKAYPLFEEIDGRPYVNIEGLKAGEYALLLLYHAYPKRINRQGLVEAVKAHVKNGKKKSTADTAVHRLKNIVDEQEGKWKLRGIGRQKAEELLKTISSNN